MLGINEILKKYDPTFSKKLSGPNSQRAEMIERLLSLMGENRRLEKEGEKEYAERIGRRFKYWLGRTRYLSPGEILGTMNQAKEGKNPGALFNHILKTTKKKVCQKSNTNQKSANTVVKRKRISSDSIMEQSTLFEL